MGRWGVSGRLGPLKVARSALLQGRADQEVASWLRDAGGVPSDWRGVTALALKEAWYDC